MKRVLVIGVAGQDGSYLADRLLADGCEVHGVYRHSSVDNCRRIAHLCSPSGVPGEVRLKSSAFHLYRGDLTDPLSVDRIVRAVSPTEIYHVADQDNVGWSEATPAQTMDVTAGAVCRLLETVRSHDKSIRVFLPSSSTIFRVNENAGVTRADEDSPLDPRSPYAVAKVAVLHLARMYRARYGMFVVCGIMFNHDSPRRRPGYVVQDVCRQAALVAAGELERVTVVDGSVTVDVGYAEEYMDAAIRLLRLREPEDAVVATGQGFTVRQFAEKALKAACGLSNGGGMVVSLKPETRSTTGVVGIIDKIVDLTKWKPHTVGYDLVKMVVDHHKGGES